MLGVSRARINQIEHQLQPNRDRACPPTGIWMPQLDVAEDDGWPEDPTSLGVASIRSNFP